MLPVEALLAGPRGRRLCWNLLWLGPRDSPRPDAWPDVWRAVMTEGDVSAKAGALADCVTAARPPELAADPAALLEALQAAVTLGAYWQEPSAADRALAAPAAQAALRPVAGAIAAAPAAAGWTAPLDPERQRYTQFLGDYPLGEPRLSGLAGLLAAWRTDTVHEEESLRAEPPEPLGAWSGSWWSVPARSELPLTTPVAPGLGALRLALTEDKMDWRRARCWPLKPRPRARVYEVDGPEAWSALVTRYPLDVTRSRRHDWWRATGRDATWLIPDYQAVARDYDAVHLSVLGYLATAGVALPAGDGGSLTLLAGWDPGATWWLTGVLERDGAPAEWLADGTAASGWRPAG